MLKVWEKGGDWGHQPQAEAWIVACDTYELLGSE